MGVQASPAPSRCAIPSLAGSGSIHGAGRVPWSADRRATLAGVRQIGDVVLLRYALSSRYRDE